MQININFYKKNKKLIIIKSIIIKEGKQKKNYVTFLSA